MPWSPRQEPATIPAMAVPIWMPSPPHSTTDRGAPAMASASISAKAMQASTASRAPWVVRLCWAAASRSAARSRQYRTATSASRISEPFPAVWGAVGPACSTPVACQCCNVSFGGVADVEAGAGAGIATVAIPVVEPGQQVGLVQSTTLGKAFGERQRHRRVVGPFSGPESERSAADHVGERSIAVTCRKLKRSADGIAGRQPEYGADRRLRIAATVVFGRCSVVVMWRRA